MSKTYTITSSQISSLHNGMCSMYRLRDLTQDMFKEDSTINQLINEVFKNIEPVKEDLMGKKDADFDRILKLAKQIASEHELHYSIWSIYDIESFDDKSNVPTGATIVAPWETKQSVVTKGDTWLDLWKAVEELALKAKDEDGEGLGNHVFIEKFVKVNCLENTYEVWLGS